MRSGLMLLELLEQSCSSNCRVCPQHLALIWVLTAYLAHSHKPSRELWLRPSKYNSMQNVFFASHFQSAQNRHASLLLWPLSIPSTHQRTDGGCPGFFPRFPSGSSSSPCADAVFTDLCTHSKFFLSPKSMPVGPSGHVQTGGCAELGDCPTRTFPAEDEHVKLPLILAAVGKQMSFPSFYCTSLNRFLYEWADSMH